MKPHDLESMSTEELWSLHELVALVLARKPSETWAGRGKQPRWLTAQLRSGKLLDDFRIQPSSGRGAPRKVATLMKRKSGRG
jgi:hypothetical protein